MLKKKKKPNTLVLPLQGAQIPSLIRELDPTCHMAWPKKKPRRYSPRS